MHKKTLQKMLQLRISSGIFGGLSLPPPYILEIISGLFSRLTHLTFQNKTLQLISLNFPFHIYYFNIVLQDLLFGF